MSPEAGALNDFIYQEMLNNLIKEVREQNTTIEELQKLLESVD